jgi:MFS family permease
MLAVVRSTWALLLGIALLMMGHGLQSTLLSLRAGQVFGTILTGMVMSGYFVGLILGALLTPRLVAHVGHVRVFAALVSLASTTILFQSLFVEPVAWFLMRVVTGTCFCAAYIVAESWLNGRATNDSRGQLFSIYMVIQLGGFAGGQFLLPLADPAGYALFITVSVLVSLAVVPILLSDNPAPPMAPYRSFGLGRLFRVSPLGCAGVACVGLSQAAFFAMGPVFASKIGLGTAGISSLIAAVVLGGVLLQYPLGRLSDRFDRRTVLTVVTLLAAVSIFGAAVQPDLPVSVLFAMFFLFGGLSLPLYSISVAHINDFLSAEEVVGASSALLLTNALGCVLGPSAAAFAMESGARGFVLYLICVHLGLGAFALWRMTRRAAPPLDAQGPTVFISSSASAVAQEERQQTAAAARAG